MSTTQPANTLAVREFITCPHCWHEFPVDQTLWIAESPDNLGDPRLGESAPQRFLPTRFDAKGAAIDSAGFPCRKLACPHCHLVLPRPCFEIPPYFISIVGAPASGKSYFLASMIWKLRQTLPRSFGIDFSDADPEMNLRVHQYESTLFLDFGSQHLVALEKTEVYGSSYDTVLINGQRVAYPQPFVFSISPSLEHPNAENALRFSQLLALYDNAGESYLPGADSATHPVTWHLAQSHSLFFLYDPTQDHRFREACKSRSDDPQLRESLDGTALHRSPVRQDVILAEMIRRIRDHLGLSLNQKHKRPLYVVLTKLDAWKSLLPGIDWSNPWKKVTSRDPESLMVVKGGAARSPETPSPQPTDFGGEWDRIFDREEPPEEKKEAAAEPSKYRSPLAGFSMKNVETVSQTVRELLLKLAPEIVTTAEHFAEEVLFIPMSATGLSPSLDPQSGALGFRPKDLSPIWAEVPLLHALAKSTRGIIPTLQPKR